MIDDNGGLCVYGLFGSGAGGKILHGQRMLWTSWH